MKTMLIIGIMGVLVLSGCAHSANWVEIATGYDYDQSSISRNGVERTVWMKRHFTDKPYENVVGLMQIDCAGKRARTVESYKYAANGDWMGPVAEEYKDWIRIPPGTVIELMMGVVCP